MSSWWILFLASLNDGNGDPGAWVGCEWRSSFWHNQEKTAVFYKISTAISSCCPLPSLCHCLSQEASCLRMAEHPGRPTVIHISQSSQKQTLKNVHCPVSCSSCYNFWFPYALGNILNVFNNVMSISLGISRGECCSLWNGGKEPQKNSTREDTGSKKRKETVIKSSSVDVWSMGTEVLCMYNQSHKNDVIKIRLTLIQCSHNPSLEWLILRIKILLWKEVCLD